MTSTRPNAHEIPPIDYFQRQERQRRRTAERFYDDIHRIADALERIVGPAPSLQEVSAEPIAEVAEDTP